MPKVVRTYWVLLGEAHMGEHCDTCGTNKLMRIPVITTNGVGEINACSECKRRARDDVLPSS